MPPARLFTIRGRVQGVFFRASTRNVAESLGITGHAVNLPNGEVEVLACGDADALDQLAEWLQDGPPHARVEDVTALDVDRQPPSGFRTG